MTLRHSFAAALAVGVAVVAPGLASSADLPAGAVVAFTPQTVCETLPGGWKEYVAAEGRVVVGAQAGLPPASAAPSADYWTKGVSLKPENLPKTPVTGAGQIVVTTPVAPLKVDPKAVAFSDAPTLRLYGYQVTPPKPGPSETLPVGYGAPGSIGADAPTPAAVAPPYVALRYCVKQ